MVPRNMHQIPRQSPHLSISVILSDGQERHPDPIVREITSRQNPLVAEYRALARHRPAGQIAVLLEGFHLVEEALAAGIAIKSAAVARRALADPQIEMLVERLEPMGTDVVAVSEAVLGAMSPVPSPSGLVAIAELRPAGLDEVFGRRPQLVLVSFDLQDPGNAGALVRSAVALGATGVIFCGASADPFSWKALRGSMGSAFHVPVVGRADGSAVIAAARAAGLSLCAAVPAGGRSVLDVDLTGPTAFLLGGEGSGLDPEIVAAADQRVSIPMAPRVESLNVSVAAALLAWEARRQRRERLESDRHE
jgi:TrmH family RNA methyltransferase